MLQLYRSRLLEIVRELASQGCLGLKCYQIRATRCRPRPCSTLASQAWELIGRKVWIWSCKVSITSDSYWARSLDLVAPISHVLAGYWMCGPFASLFFRSHYSCVGGDMSYLWRLCPRNLTVKDRAFTV